jgi:hypothetical protein
MSSPARLWAAAVLATGVACAPSPEAPVQVMALVRSGGSAGSYQPTQVSLRTVGDPVSLTGSVAQLIGGARIDVDPADPLLRLNGGNLNEEQIARVFVKDSGRDPRTSYVEKDGVLWPADFHSWNLVTTYYNFEQAFEHFQAVGVPAAVLGVVKVYYFPEFILRELGPRPLNDNALYFSPVQAFMILPFDQLQATPLSINQGIVAHEYSHLVWNRLVFGNQAFPTVLGRWSGTSQVNVNILKSLDEGLADFHAFAASCRSAFGCDTRFMQASFNAAQTDARDISRLDRCFTAGLRNSLQSLGINEFTGLGLHYQVGTAFASSLFHAGRGPEEWALLSRALVESYQDGENRGLAELLRENLETPQLFSLEAAMNVFLAHVSSEELRERLCGQFLGRMNADRAAMPACPAASAPAEGCAP